MGWNYRLVYHPPSKYKVGNEEFDREEYLAIHEVYYNENDEPHMMTIKEIVTGDEDEDSLVSLKWILENQMKALTRPILGYEIEDNIYKEIDKEKQNEFSKSIEDKK
jgi:hypothetical protein